MLCMFPGVYGSPGLGVSSTPPDPTNGIMACSIRSAVSFIVGLCLRPVVWGYCICNIVSHVFLLVSCSCFFFGPFEDAICEHLGQKPWSRMPPPDTELYALDQQKRQKADEKNVHGMKPMWMLPKIQHTSYNIMCFLFGWSASSLVWILLLVRARVTYTTKGGIETPGRQVGYSFVDISGGITKELNGIDSRHMCIVHAGRSRFFSNSLWQVVTDADQLNRLIREGRCPIGSHRWGMNQHMPCKVSLMRHRFSIGYVGGLNFTCVVAKRTRWYP